MFAITEVPIPCLYLHRNLGNGLDAARYCSNVTIVFSECPSVRAAKPDWLLRFVLNEVASLALLKIPAYAGRRLVL